MLEKVPVHTYHAYYDSLIDCEELEVIDSVLICASTAYNELLSAK
jgi:hypothetical protein